MGIHGQSAVSRSGSGALLCRSLCREPSGGNESNVRNLPGSLRPMPSTLVADRREPSGCGVKKGSN